MTFSVTALLPATAMPVNAVAALPPLIQILLADCSEPMMFPGPTSAFIPETAIPVKLTAPVPENLQFATTLPDMTDGAPWLPVIAIPVNDTFAEFAK